MFNVTGKRFVGGYSPKTGEQMLMIADYKWWADNETSILEWMDDNLSRGRDHQTGMILSFDSKEELTWFLLRWSA